MWICKKWGDFIETDYIDKIFDYWKVVGTDGHRLICKCKCGKVETIPKNKLLNGKTKSCKDCKFIRRYDGIKGKVYGNYEVISDAYKKDYNNGKYIFVECKCLLCGRVKELPVSALMSRKIGMCQKCAAKRNLIEANADNAIHKFDNNIYEEMEDYFILHIGEHCVLFYKDDYDLVKNHVWRIIGNYVFTGHLKDVDFISMHRMILEKIYIGKEIFNSKYQADHINRNGYDNRKII